MCLSIARVGYCAWLLCVQSRWLVSVWLHGNISNANRHVKKIAKRVFVLALIGTAVRWIDSMPKQRRPNKLAEGSGRVVSPQTPLEAGPIIRFVPRSADGNQTRIRQKPWRERETLAANFWCANRSKILILPAWSAKMDR
jgi:hypothetical protein